jgi:hypothetical protein
LSRLSYSPVCLLSCSSVSLLLHSSLCSLSSLRPPAHLFSSCSHSVLSLLFSFPPAFLLICLLVLLFSSPALLLAQLLSPARLLACSPHPQIFLVREGARVEGPRVEGWTGPSLLVCRSTRTVCCIKLLLHALLLIMTSPSHHPRRSRS